MLHEVQAKSYSPGKFSVYENSDYKIRMLYPAEWKVSETGLSSYGIAGFSAKEVKEEVTSLHSVIYVPARVYIFAEPVKNVNWTLDDYFKDLMKTTYTSNHEYKILNTSSATLAGLPAFTSLLYDYKDDSTSKVMRTIAIANDTVYRISYYSDPGNFNEYLPTVTEMINSFEINYTPTESISGKQNREFVSNISSSDAITNTAPMQDVVLLSQKLKKGDGEYNDIIGQVKNVGSDVVDSVKIGVTFYNKNRDIIGTDSTYAEASALKANQKSTFDILSKKHNFVGMASYELSLYWQDSVGTDQYVENAQIYKVKETKK